MQDSHSPFHAKTVHSPTSQLQVWLAERQVMCKAKMKGGMPVAGRGGGGSKGGAGLCASYMHSKTSACSRYAAVSENCRWGALAVLSVSAS